MDFKTYEEYRDAYWKYINRICEIENPKNSSEYKDIIECVDKMQKQYPNFHKLYLKWMEEVMDDWCKEMENKK